ncbi:uncharacterized protein [Ptychodera flava]|uniref:uncharacterized protein isoform X2 n=1 Tax=Ptychodera flava TaxID=63121 RepID=UPI00396A9ACB
MKNAVFLAVVTLVISLTTAQPDIGVKSFTITTPATLTTGLCDAETVYTFDIVVCNVGGTDNTVTAVKLHYANGDSYYTATTKGNANTATLGSGASDIDVSANAEASNTGATATVSAESAGACAKYTHICAVISGSLDSTAFNDDACIALDGGTISTRNCPFADCDDPGTVENAQKQGDTFAHGDTVTYTCNANYHLVGEETLTCNDGNGTMKFPCAQILHQLWEVQQQQKFSRQQQNLVVGKILVDYTIA